MKKIDCVACKGRGFNIDRHDGSQRYEVVKPYQCETCGGTGNLYSISDEEIKTIIHIESELSNIFNVLGKGSPEDALLLLASVLQNLRVGEKYDTAGLHTV